jgi:hypothetical protein
VVSTLGTGGMGVVWKAIDTRLNRPVAIKAIRDPTGVETQAVLRLRAEALAAAALDHPYICKIYELLETEQGTLVVMEFVEGETLDAILERGVPPVLDTLRYGSEIAEGLANAHANGIIHRDVKPSNVMVTPHGHVKLLDFGIARAAPAGDLPTEAALTKPGMIPGTPQYMAPEQALGKRIDAKIDVFALGVLLFECLTGQRPFEGATRDAYVQQMLTGRMRPLERLAPSTPEAVCDVVKSCLEQKADKRPTAASMAQILRRYADALSTASTGLPVSAPRGLPRWVIQAAVLLLVAAAIALAWTAWRARTGDDPASWALLPAVTWPSAESTPRISPDGRWLSFISDRDNQTRIFVKSLDGGDAVPVVLAGIAESYVWSPDGRELAVVMRQNEERFLVVVPAFFGGTPRTSVRLDAALGDTSISRWIDDTVFLRTLRKDVRSIATVTIGDGRLQELTATWPSGFTVRHLDVAPGGNQLAVEATADGHSDLWVASLDGSNLRRLTNDSFVDRGPIWIGPEAVAFQSNRGGQLDLWEHSLETARTTQITSSDTVERAGGASADGAVLAFEQALNTMHLWRLDVATGSAKQLTGDALSDFSPSIAGDDGRLAFQRAKPTPTEGYQFFDSRILVTSLTGATAEPQSIADGFAARLSPDGQWVAYYQRLPDARRLRLIARNIGTGEARTLSDDCVPPSLSLLPVDWVDQPVTWGPNSADLYYFAYYLDAGIEGTQILRSPVDSHAAPAVIARAPVRALVRELRLSPDGRLLAYIVAAAGKVELHVLDAADGRDTILLREERALSNRYIPGWSTNRTVLLQDARHTGGRRYEHRFEEIAVDGTRRPIATAVDNAAPTTKLDRARRRLFVTRAVDGIHNVFVLSLADGSLRRVTANESPGVYFSAITPQGTDSIIYARDERKRDIWLVKRGHQ